MTKGPEGRPLHVLILGDWLPFPHGMATTGRALLMARALSEAGARVRVLCLQATERSPHIRNTAVYGRHAGIPFEYASGTTVRHDSFIARRIIAAWGWVHGAMRLARIRRDGGLDLVLLWFWAPRPCFRLLCFTALLRLLGVPVVREVNESPWSQKVDASALERIWSPLAGMDGAVTISADLHEWAVRETAHRPGFRVVDVPILVDLGEHSPLAYPRGDPLVVFAGAPAYKATIAFILSAMNEVWCLHPECRIAITGADAADPAAKWLWAAVAKRGLKDRVDLVGFLPRAELLALYARAHALLIPLFEDQQSRARFPTKIGEYLGAARPVVTNAVGDIPLYFTHGVDAIICPPNDPAAFGSSIAELLSEPEQAALIGQRGRMLAERRFHYGLYGNLLVEALGDVVCSRAAQ